MRAIVLSSRRPPPARVLAPGGASARIIHSEPAGPYTAYLAVLFGVKTRANVRAPGGAASRMEKLLAWIKSLFAPSRAAPPPHETPITAPPAAETEPTEPVVLAEAPLAEPEPEPATLLVAEPPGPLEEAPIDEPAAVELEPASGDGLTLRLESERGTPSTFQVTKTGATIGRGPESTIQLADLSVSRKHARIAYRQGAYWLSDLGSMGGTWVDGAKLAAPRRVAAGQTIDIGLCRLVVVAAAEGEKTGAAKGPSNAA
jgi:hypothetical protein